MDLKYIKVKNFRNYSNDELSLVDSSFWILRGKNSAGKSTLACDALTYSLFGTIKAMSDFRDQRLSVDDVIKRGKRKAEVVIGFVHKGDDYRVSRIREVRGKSKGRELVNLWKNDTEILSNATKTKAAEWISENLWNYDDFTNTTLILQDEMTKALEMSISKRKDYIETIFGIKKFVQMSAISRDKATEIAKTIEVDELHIRDEEKLSEELKFKLVELPVMEESLASKKKLHDKLIERKEELKRKQKDLEATQSSYNSLNKEQVELTNIIETRKGEIKKIKDELDKIKSILKNKAHLISKQKEIDKLERKIESYESTKTNQLRLQNQIEMLRASIENEKNRLVKVISENQNELLSRSTELQSKLKEIETIKTQQVDEPILKKAISREREAQDLIVDMEKLQEEFNRLSKELAVKETKLASSIEADLKNITLLRDKIKEKARVSREYATALDGKNKEKIVNGEIEQFSLSRESLRNKINDLKTTRKLVVQEIEGLSQNILTIQEEIQTLSSLHEQAICPTCKQSLSENHVESIVINSNSKINLLDEKRKNQRIEIETIDGNISAYEKEYETLEKQYKSKLEEKASIQNNLRNLDALESLMDDIRYSEKEISNFDSNGGTESLYPDLRGEIKEILSKFQNTKFDVHKLSEARVELTEIVKKKQQLDHIIEGAKRLDPLQIDIKSLTTRVQELTNGINRYQGELDQGTYAPQERQSLKKYQDDLLEINLELKGEEDLRKQLSLLEPARISQQILELEKAETSQIQLNSSFEHQNIEIANENNKLSFLLHDLNDPKYSNLEEKIVESAKKVSDNENEISESLKQKIHLKEEINQKKILIHDHKKHLEEIKSIVVKIQLERDKKDDYELLEKIFKQIGGRILARLRNQISLETINIFNMLGNPQLQGISIKEDFSLAIQTPDGEEVASFFSGGQRIRIGFALRLALSKVLAEYRGNEVETLIIDEGGFGALDQDGQDGVVEVFTAMQDRFRRVLIISHINNIAERLPGIQVHIEDGKIIKKTVFSPSLM